MSTLLQRNTTLRTYKGAWYATDFTLNISNWPAGNYAEAKSIFGSKHKLYGYKAEVSVLRNRLAIGLRVHY